MNQTISHAANGNTQLITESSLSVHLDYLRVKISTTLQEFDQVFLLIDHKYLTVEMERQWRPGKFCPSYENSFRSPYGARGGFTINDEENRVEIMIDFTGEYFSHIDNQDTWRLIQGLGYRFNAKCLRIDIAVDDPTFEIIPAKEMRRAWADGNGYGFRNYKTVASGTSPRTMQRTDYYGSRYSRKMVRVYKHKDKCLRLETEFKGKYAQGVFSLLLGGAKKRYYDMSSSQESGMDFKLAVKNFQQIVKDSPAISKLSLDFGRLHGCDKNFSLGLSQMLGGIAVSAIDFRDKSKLKDKTKACERDCPRLPFWQEFKDKVGIGIKVHTPTPENSVGKTIAWMRRQTSKTLAKLKEALGAYKFNLFVRELTEKGREKFELSDEKFIQFVKDNPKICGLDYG